MKNLISTTTLAAALLTASSAFAQQRSLLFTTHSAELTRAAKPASLRKIDTEDVASVVPNPAAPHSARKFAPHDAYCTLVGDEDGDGEFFESPLAGNIDALLWCPFSTGASMRELYISTSETLEGNVNLGTGLAGAPTTARPGDVFRVVIDPANGDGQFSFLLREEQIRSAFAIDPNDEINVDAITAVWQADMIYLSFEEDHTVTVNNPGGPYTLVAGDGAILGLRIQTIGEPVTLAPNAALMVATEGQVDTMVAASGIRRSDGTAAATIEDLDGLHPVRNTGTFVNNWGTFHDLMFSGERLTGGGIVTTSGAIAQINGVTMGNVGGPTTGVAVGLDPNAVGSLNGLHARAANMVGNFVTETPDAVIHGGGILQLDIEGIAGPGPAFLLLDVSTLPIHGMGPVGGPLFPTYFPETLWPVPVFFGVGLNADGVGSWAIPAPAIDLKLIFQAAQPVPGGFVLSTPTTVELYST